MPLPAHSDRPDWSWQSGRPLAVIVNWTRTSTAGLQRRLGAAKTAALVQRAEAHAEHVHIRHGSLDCDAGRDEITTRSASPQPQHVEDRHGRKRCSSAPWPGLTLLGRHAERQPDEFPNLIAFAGQRRRHAASEIRSGLQLYLGRGPVDGHDACHAAGGQRSFHQGLSSPTTRAAHPGGRPTETGWSSNPTVPLSRRTAARGCTAIYLFDYSTANATAVQLTDPMYNMNHAKWYPNGFNGVSGRPDPGRGGLSDGSRCGGAAVWHRQP